MRDYWEVEGCPSSYLISRDESCTNNEMVTPRNRVVLINGNMSVFLFPCKWEMRGTTSELGIILCPIQNQNYKCFTETINRHETKNIILHARERRDYVHRSGSEIVPFYLCILIRIIVAFELWRWRTEWGFFSSGEVRRDMVKIIHYFLFDMSWACET